jgi:hypothetical protein
VNLVRVKLTGIYTRRVWFLYEWLLGRKLNLPDADKVSYVDAVDTKLQFAGNGQNLTRHRVCNNLPGTPEFCPLVFRTAALEQFVAAGGELGSFLIDEVALFQRMDAALDCSPNSRCSIQMS